MRTLEQLYVSGVGPVVGSLCRRFVVDAISSPSNLSHAEKFSRLRGMLSAKPIDGHVEGGALPMIR